MVFQQQNILLLYVTAFWYIHGIWQFIFRKLYFRESVGINKQQYSIKLSQFPSLPGTNITNRSTLGTMLWLLWNMRTSELTHTSKVKFARFFLAKTLSCCVCGTFITIGYDE